MTGPAEEMEVFALVSRKFKQIFQRQEHMKTFKTYDLMDVSNYLTLTDVLLSRDLQMKTVMFF